MVTKNISIGKDEWIEWVEFDPQNVDLFELDLLLKPTEKLWKALETECVVGCCGIDALSSTFDISVCSPETESNF